MGRAELPPEPEPPKDLSSVESEYKGRKFYGPQGLDRAELTYLRDWKQWADAKLSLIRQIVGAGRK